MKFNNRPMIIHHLYDHTIRTVPWIKQQRAGGIDRCQILARWYCRISGGVSRLFFSCIDFFQIDLTRVRIWAEIKAWTGIQS